ncbi:MAG: biotin--[acetyl-CoA-carboxylase] ligase [Chitinophagales bacterium]
MPDTPFQQPIGMPFIELQTIDSTNNYALSQIHAGLAQHGLVIFSHEQTTGKGQRGKKWASANHAGIAISIVIDPGTMHLSQQFQLSACTAVTLQRFFGKYAGKETKIKWPNDLYWKDRKAGGILIESGVGSKEAGGGNTEDGGGRTAAGGRRIESGVSRWQWAVIGIGVNINQTSFPGELPNPVSLKQITGKNYDTIELAKELCSLFNDEFEKLVNSRFEEIYAYYLSHLYKINEKVKLRKDNRVFETMVKSVSPGGRLIVEHGIEEEFDFGSVEWLINQ